MKAKVIRTEEEYQAALAMIEKLMDAVPGSAEEDDLELYAILVDHYEHKHYPIDPPDPIEAIKFRMDQQGLTRKDLIPYIGSQSKVSEVLNRKRPLSLSMIRALEKGLGIPAAVLIQDPGSRAAEFSAEEEAESAQPALPGSPAAEDAVRATMQSILAQLKEITARLDEIAVRPPKAGPPARKAGPARPKTPQRPAAEPALAARLVSEAQEGYRIEPPDSGGAKRR